MKSNLSPINPNAEGNKVIETMIRNILGTENNIELFAWRRPERKSSLFSDVPVNSNIKPIGSEVLSFMEKAGIINPQHLCEDISVNYNIKPIGSEVLSSMKEADITEIRSLCKYKMCIFCSNLKYSRKYFSNYQQAESKNFDYCMSSDRNGFDIPELDRNSDFLKNNSANSVLTGPIISWADIVREKKDQCCDNLMKMWREHLDGKPVIIRVCLKENHTDKGLVSPDNSDKLALSVVNFVLDEEI